jgi:nucleotide-binding universal stress UspA family protein
MIKRILVGLGGTPFTTVAIRRAIELAQFHQASLTGITVVNINQLTDLGPGVGMGAEEYVEQTIDHRIKVTRQRLEAVIEEFESACATSGITYSVKRETGNPFELMISHSRYHDLVVFGLRGLFDYGLVDKPKNMLSHLIEAGVRPVIAVAPEYRQIRQALIAYSGSMESAKTIQRFIQLRSWPNVKISIVCFEQHEYEPNRLLTDAAEYCRAYGFDVIDTKYIPASVNEVLLQYARNCNADIIVMGNSARSVLRRRILGDTVLRVIRNTDRALFLGQ